MSQVHSLAKQWVYSRTSRRTCVWELYGNGSSKVCVHVQVRIFFPPVAQWNIAQTSHQPPSTVNDSQHEQSTPTEGKSWKKLWDRCWTAATKSDCNWLLFLSIILQPPQAKRHIVTSIFEMSQDDGTPFLLGFREAWRDLLAKIKIWTIDTSVVNTPTHIQRWCIGMKKEDLPDF